jgi:hypothetical protein
MPPARDAEEALHRLRMLLSQTPDRSYAREVLESTLPILDEEARHEAAIDDASR